MGSKVENVRPSSHRLRENTAYRVTSRSSLCLLVYYLFQNLQHYLTIFSDGQEYGDTSSRSRAFNGCFILEEFGTSSGTFFLMLELQLVSLFALDTAGLLPDELHPGGRPSVHLPRDLISVLMSALAVLNTL
ncbi:hypothetical protein MRX96_009763 [Rhipicephalus microplus]